MAHKLTVVSDAHVRIEPSSYVSRVWPYEKREDESAVEARARKYDAWAKDLKEFFRDHRSQDVNFIEVVREYEDVCSACGRRWEVSTEGAEGEPVAPFCAWCGADVDTAGRESLPSNEVGK